MEVAFISLGSFIVSSKNVFAVKSPEAGHLHCCQGIRPGMLQGNKESSGRRTI
ncbi:MAG TPA: hypothetical protein VFL47_07430 [Flavisolibacter sp.]|nr:hypothetical protein [Flavisolibacter sp.]